MYLNGIVLEELTDTFTTVPLNPINLYAEPKDKSTIFLSWSDRSHNETGFELQRATSPSGPWTSVNLGSNVTSFTNVAGDYNGNGVVDAADYAIWRKNVGGAGGSASNGDSSMPPSLTVSSSSSPTDSRRSSMTFFGSSTP